MISVVGYEGNHLLVFIESAGSSRNFTYGFMADVKNPVEVKDF